MYVCMYVCTDIYVYMYVCMHQTGKTTILDIAVIHTESESYIRKNLSPKKVLEKHEKAKKRKHLNNCLQNRRNFVPFVMSTDGMMAPEAKAFVKLLARKLADKWQAPYSKTCAWVKTRITIATLRATNHCIHGSRVSFRDIGYPFECWEDGAGIGLFQAQEPF